MENSSAQDLPIPTGANHISVANLLAVGLATRLFIDTGTKIFFPFLSIIANGMGISTVVLGRLVSLRSLMGLFAPLFGYMAVRYGYRLTMRLALLLTALGFLTLGLSNNIWLAALGMMFMGIGSYSFVPTLQAYLSNRLPYHQRARGLGILEYSWALASIVGLYFVGQLLEIASWRLPFFIIGGTVFVAGMLYGRLPSASDTAARSTAKGEAVNLSLQAMWTRIAAYFDLGRQSRSAFATIATSNLLMFGAFNVFITYGIWMFTDFNLLAGALGGIALILGLADLSGSVLVSVVSDRFGKRRSVLAGAIIACLGFWSLPFLSKALITAMVGMVIARAAFEFAIVANMTLLSEQAPQQRAKALTLGAAFSVVSASVASLSGPWLFDRYGIQGVSLVSGLATLAGILMLLWRVREPEVD